MSIAIPRSLLTQEHKEIIRKLLYVQAEPTRHGQRGEAFTFYSVEVTEIYPDHVHLPFTFAKALNIINTSGDNIGGDNIGGDNISGDKYNNENKYMETDIQFTGSLRDEQPIIAEEVLTNLFSTGATTLKLPPGSGKTILGAWIACKLGLLTIVLVHRQLLFKQWKKSFEEHTTAKIWVVGEEVPEDGCNVILCLVNRVDQVPESMRLQFGFLIVDEARELCTPTGAKALLAWHPKYILLESATPFRADGLETMLYALAGEKQVARGYTKPFTVVLYKTNIKGERKLNKIGAPDWSVLQKSLLMNPKRNELILNMVKNNIDMKILILTKLVDHVKLLCELLTEQGIQCDHLSGSKNNYLDSSVLVGTMSKIGVGFDEANACNNYSGVPINLLILASSIKDLAVLEQNVGRAFRSDEPYIIHMVDSDRIIQGHWNIAKKWYLENCGVIDMRKG